MVSHGLLLAIARGFLVTVSVVIDSTESALSPLTVVVINLTFIPEAKQWTGHMQWMD